MSRYVPQFKSAGDNCCSTMCYRFNIFGRTTWNKISLHAFVKLKCILRLQVELLIKKIKQLSFETKKEKEVEVGVGLVFIYLYVYIYIYLWERVQ